LAPPAPTRASLRAAAAAAVLAVLTFALFARAGGNGFLFFDDDQYVTANPVVRAGLTADGVRWAFSTFFLSNWHPLAWLSHMLDVELFGLAPGPPHLVNAGLHALNAALLLLLLARASGAVGLSAVVAALFAVHPLHVESVAWVSERKDLLSTSFGFLFLAAWGWHAHRPSWRRHAVALLLLAASLLSKAMWITAPALLLLLDWWPLQRVDAPWAPRDPRCPALPRLPPRALLLEKVPAAVLSLAVAGVAVVAQARGGALNSLERLPVADRLANATGSLVAYLGLAAWPARLSAYYPIPPLSTGRALAAAALLLAVTAVAWSLRRRMPWVAVGWLGYVIMLVPVIGVVQVGSQGMADRYTYVPLTGVFVAVAWTLDAVVRTRAARAALAGATALALAALAAATWTEIARWHDQVTLFTRAVEVTGGDGRAWHLLSQGFLAEGRYAEAVPPAREAARLDPQNPRAHKNLGYALYRAGRVEEAAAALERAVALDPGYTEAHENLAIVYGRLGRGDEAMREMRRAMQGRAAPAP
jgi:tetratricopeptide (TPR) repeat protein